MNFRSSYKAISTIGGHKIFKTWKKPVRIWIRGVSALECGHRVVQNQKIIATDGYLIFPSDESSYSVIFSDFAISACTDDPYRIAVGKTHKSGASNIPPNIHVFLRYQRCIAIAFAWCETRFHCSAGPKCVSTILYGWSVHHKPSRIHGKLARMTSDYFANQIRRHIKCFGYARSTPWLRKKITYEGSTSLLSRLEMHPTILYGSSAQRGSRKISENVIWIPKFYETCS